MSKKNGHCYLFLYNLNKKEVDTISYKTKSANNQTVVRKWHVIDADGLIVGRMCTKVASILRGKHKPSYTPHVDTGDYVIVLNADKLRLTGNKVNDKVYLRYSGYPGGQRFTTAEEMLKKKPIFLVENAIRGMLPKNRLGAELFRNLYVYEGAEHNQEAQQPRVIELETIK